MEFAHAENFWYLLGILPVFFFAFWGCKLRENQISHYGVREIIKWVSLIVSFKRKFWRESLIVSMVAALFIAGFAQLHIEKEEDVYLPEGVGGIIIMDASHSMNAEDITDIDGQKASRIETAKKEIFDFLCALKEKSILGSGRLGLVTFARYAKELFSLTLDVNALQMAVKMIYTSEFDYKEEQGTNIAVALYIANWLFEKFDERQKERQKKPLNIKFVVLLSDGEETNREELENNLAKYREKNIKVFTIGVGNYKKVQIPSVTPGKIYEEFTTTFSPETLIEIAQKTGGEYYHFVESGQLKKSLESIFSKADLTKKVVTEKEDVSWWFYSAALVLMFIWGWNNFIQTSPRSLITNLLRRK